MNWHQRIKQRLQQRQSANIYRTRQPNQAVGCCRLLINNKKYINFSSNDYLGLSQNKSIIAAWQQGAKRYGVGSGASGHVTGYTLPHQQLEEQLADWLGYPRALLFISGYVANQTLLAALIMAKDRILADRFSHASLLEAAMHSPAQLRRFHHNQPDSLQKLLDKPCSGQTLVITEGLFSMEGDSAPLSQLQQKTTAAAGWLLVDDAHGIGVRGEQGRGSCWQQGIQPELLVITFGKAFGLSGAAVLCQKEVAEYLLQFSGHLIYSTAMPPAQACALQAALIRIQQGDDLRDQLQQRIKQFRAGAANLRLPLLPSDSAIQPLLVGDNKQTLLLANQLRSQGLWVTAIRPPTVPPGTARLRITLTAAHRATDIDRLLEVLDAINHAKC
ncbi:8-amino-7-oxononanoate synthase [Candidatus Regiella insecticola 5.15]|uniref:8-amino-7-oxononanoate synthase n=1 Tax=Candidatus Regiella insecticola 5.15 TaxID=1005043 RepID=G2GYQ2_9ENTR|nr:8-amino-7-oxononanoate synthase [Candidatus Regiella insecticola]EGY29130.1 8-amino-7-oxononanoate synthase [Candidatus Regiella insecticola 5.15]